MSTHEAVCPQRTTKPPTATAMRGFFKNAEKERKPQPIKYFFEQLVNDNQ